MIIVGSLHFDTENLIAGMCLIDTMDGALMLSLYVQPAANFLPKARRSDSVGSSDVIDVHTEGPNHSANPRDPVAFLYYSIVLTTLTVIVAIVIGVIQLLTMIQNVAEPKGKFWDGVETAGDYYDVIGGSICGLFLICGLLSVALYKPWRRWFGKRHGQADIVDEEGSLDGDAGGISRVGGEISTTTTAGGNLQEGSAAADAVGKGSATQVSVKAAKGDQSDPLIPEV